MEVVRQIIRCQDSVFAFLGINDTFAFKKHTYSLYGKEIKSSLPDMQVY